MRPNICLRNFILFTQGRPQHIYVIIQKMICCEQTSGQSLRSCSSVLFRQDVYCACMARMKSWTCYVVQVRLVASFLGGRVLQAHICKGAQYSCYHDVVQQRRYFSKEKKQGNERLGNSSTAARATGTLHSANSLKHFGESVSWLYVPLCSTYIFQT